MGQPRYTGRFSFRNQKQLTDDQWTYMRLFTGYTHYQVCKEWAQQTEDPARTAAGLPLGPKCCFFLDSGVFARM